jgi:TonB family protein
MSDLQLYTPYKNESNPIQFKIPWDSNTARGFGLALLIAFILILLSPAFYLEPAKPVNIRINTVPLEMISFGPGDGTGISKGNLAEEGKAHKGKDPLSSMHDAEVSAKTKFDLNNRNIDVESARDFAARNELSSESKNNETEFGSGRRDVGSKDGTKEGTGLGDRGYGPGLGPGIGPIDWGGGGNRTVLYKKLPEYPKGVNTSAEIKIRFTVSRDGTVISMVPLQKGDPALEQAAMKALKQWRFNPLQEEKSMYGIITFTFKLS